MKFSLPWLPLESAGNCGGLSHFVIWCRCKPTAPCASSAHKAPPGGLESVFGSKCMGISCAVYYILESFKLAKIQWINCAWRIFAMGSARLMYSNTGKLEEVTKDYQKALDDATTGMDNAFKGRLGMMNLIVGRIIRFQVRMGLDFAKDTRGK